MLRLLQTGQIDDNIRQILHLHSIKHNKLNRTLWSDMLKVDAVIQHTDALIGM